MAGASEGGVLLQKTMDTAVIFVYPLFCHRRYFFFFKYEGNYLQGYH